MLVRGPPNGSDTQPRAERENMPLSDEELQSLNQELSAENARLRADHDEHRVIAEGLQNILYSTGMATLLLDPDFNIRFFTPATKLLFGILPGDIGRPLADLRPLAPDDALLSDAGAVLRSAVPIEREIETPGGVWYLRRILPYRRQPHEVGGVVVTFSDITERKRSADALGVAKRQAELANLAKSRFLAAASHDLRQPLQTLALLQGLLAKAVESERAHKLVGRVDETLRVMTSMLNTLLDMNQIEAGTVRVTPIGFPINDLFGRLREEFGYHAQSQRLALHVVSCGLSVETDPRLLEQMLRNLLSNAVKYTKRGGVLLGCRRRAGRLCIEVWDTGVGIPESEHEAIFEEYHQLDNSARNRSRGLGLGLAIVRRLGKLLGHRIAVRSRPGKGSVFSIEVPLSLSRTAMPPALQHEVTPPAADLPHRVCVVLVVEDDPELRELLVLSLKDEGHRVVQASDGLIALEWLAQSTTRPDIVLADFNLPHGLNGIQLVVRLRQSLQREVPVIILTGDISTDTLRDIALKNCVQLNKPVRLSELKEMIQRLIPASPTTPVVSAPESADADGDRGLPVVFVVDDNSHVRDGIRGALEAAGRLVEDYPDCESFLNSYRPGREACLLIDASLPGMSGLELLQHLQEAGDPMPSIMITGNSDVPMAVQVMKAGALDFIEKPISHDELLASVERALEQSRGATKLSAWRADAAEHVAGLTSRQREIMDLVLAGHPSKNIAADLGISQRTVENHRAAIMRKTGSKSLPALARLALAAASTDQTIDTEAPR
jgi:two-component system CheB/CheR fusion protein